MKIRPHNDPATASALSPRNHASRPSPGPKGGWLLLRHAQTLGSHGCFVGRSDRAIDTVDPALVTDLLANIGHVDIVVLTPLRRTRQTLDLLLAQGLPQPRKILVEPDLVEQDFGSWDERSYDDLADQDPDYWPFWDDPAGQAPPGGESFEQVCQRVQAAHRRLAARHDGNILHVGHAGPIRALLAMAQGDLPQAALTRVVSTLSLHRMQAA